MMIVICAKCNAIPVFAEKEDRSSVKSPHFFSECFKKVMVSHAPSHDPQPLLCHLFTGSDKSTVVILIVADAKVLTKLYGKTFYQNVHACTGFLQWVAHKPTEHRVALKALHFIQSYQFMIVCIIFLLLWYLSSIVDIHSNPCTFLTLILELKLTYVNPTWQTSVDVFSRSLLRCSISAITTSNHFTLSGIGLLF